jgi:hypothetical protein
VVAAVSTRTQRLGGEDGARVLAPDEDGGRGPAPGADNGRPPAPGENNGRARGEALPRLAPADLLNRIRFIVHTLEEEPGLTSRELAERNSLARRNMTLLLLRLEEHGLVVRQGRRWFAGPEPVD